MAHVLPTGMLDSCNQGMIWCLANWANNVTYGAFWVFLLLGFSVVIFMASIRMGNTRAFGFGSWVGMVGGIWLAILQLISWWVASVFILVGVLGTAMMVMAKR